jgi:PPM family protein phosphatase
MLRVAETIAKTDTGRQRRENEDSALASAPVFVVADGMGGAQAGEVASRIAVETFEDGLPESGTPEERLASRVIEANHRIYEVSISESEHAGMGTTLTAAYLVDSELAIAHVGDSRAYLFRDGTLKRLTQDHSLVDELVRRGKLTEEQAAEHPQRSIITRALGPEPTVEVDTWTYPVKAGDVLMLCSDGLTSMVPEDRVQALLAANSELDAAGQALIDEANEAGGRDNITVVLFRLEDAASAVDGIVDQPTVVGAVAPASSPPRQPARARKARRVPSAPAETGRRSERSMPAWGKALAAVVAIAVVLFLVGGGGYLATRNLYFIGTNSQGIVTIYRGLPYNLVGVDLYETFYVSGVPASLIPSDRRTTILNNDLRSESSASKLVQQLELDQVSP